MMNLPFHKRIIEILDAAITYQFAESERLANELLFDIEKNQYTFIVVGEFSTGKSSFVNAIMGQSILPVGITPTTATINILKYGQEATRVHYKDGKVEELQSQQLNQFIASQLTNIEDIDYLIINRPLDFLRDDVIVIDTPGLNDLNETRVDITYNYIPRSDVVLFMLDCRMPLRKSEFDYITQALLMNGLDRIIFIANFADDVPEEELDGIVDKIQRQLTEALSISDITVIPFSAQEAIEGKQLNDEELLDISGYHQVMEKIEWLCTSGSRMKEKEFRLTHRFEVLEQMFKYELTSYKELLQQSEEELKQSLQNMRDWKQEQNEFMMKLDDYYAERIFEFKQMANKSVQKFFGDLQEEVMQKIDLYQGHNMQHYFEKELPAFIKSRLKQWIERYNPQIHILLGKLEVALTGILENKFNEKLALSRLSEDYATSPDEVQLTVQKPLDPNITSGLLVGGAGVLFLALGGSLLLPIIGMAGLPFIQKKMQENNLKKIKPQVRDELESKLLQIEHQFSSEIEQYIQTSGKQIYKEIQLIFESKAAQQEALIRGRLDSLRNSRESEQAQIEKINQLFLEMEEV